MVQRKRIIAGMLGCLLVCSQSVGVTAKTIEPVETGISWQDRTQQTDMEFDADTESDLDEKLNTDVISTIGAGLDGESAWKVNAAEETDDQEASDEENIEKRAAADVENADTDPHTDAAEDLPQSPDELQPDYNDPDYIKRLMLEEQEEQAPQTSAQFSLRSAAGFKTVSPFTGLTYIQPSRLSGREVVHGIDVSEWQAAIDWKKVKKAGVDFAFIRCGYTSLSSSFLLHEDDYFKQNIVGAYNAGIKVGIYFFSNSITTSEAKKEAKKTLELINPYKNMITMPVVYDFEAFSSSYRAYGLSKSQVTKNALAFIKLIQEEGYTPMYYGSPNFVAQQFDQNKLADYDFWLANYTTQTSYTGNFAYWQYSSSGQVNGISGNTDCNFFYTNPSGPSDPVQPVDPDEIAEDLDEVTGLMMTDNSTSHIEIEWDEVEEAHGYKVYRSASLGGTYKEIQVVSGSAITTHMDTKVAESEGRQYYYKVVPYIVEDEVMKYGGESDVLIANTEVVYKHRLKTKANLNLREQAGTEYAALTVIPKGVVLNYSKFTFSTTGKRWYKVTYKKNGNSYTGYVSGSYIKKYTYGTAIKKANLRDGAGKTYKLTNTVKKGTDLTILKNTSSQSGVPWSRVTYYKKNGKECKGYMKTKFIQQY